ncbi:flagellar assembly protein FlbE [Brevundimonas sp. A19_0]|uniref:flagellar assembly protein FlbE n=1 Tax=Brevundimonas sp. A19_0 TaxID=2821087 RepID=UPI001FD838F3|nr:flagellar assembly protein FlbE [Brevundimonas sp. A19_0]
MTVAPIPAQPFSFDTEFDATGNVVRASAWQPVKRAYSPAEVEALVADARSEGRAQALAELDSRRAQAIADLSAALAASLPRLGGVIETYREQTAELALATGRALASTALERMPHAALQAALEELGREIDASPRLVVAMAGLDEAARSEIEALCASTGYAGAVRFRDEPGLATAAFELEWADGRAAFDAAEAYARLEAAVARALAADRTEPSASSEGMNS